jgi:hypothetical protein
MTLLDAPPYNARRAKLFRNLTIAAVVIVLVGGFCTFWFWTWPAQHRVSVFMQTLEAGDLSKAYGQWNHDPDWERHKDKYSGYDFDRFTKDWGPMGDYGKIRSHEIRMAKSVGNGTVVGVDINGGKTPVFLRVDDKTKQIGFSPVELYVGP